MTNPINVITSIAGAVLIMIIGAIVISGVLQVTTNL